MPPRAQRPRASSAERKRARAPSGASEVAFHREVGQCVRELHRITPFLLADYSAPAVAASLAIHAVRALAGCVRTGEISQAHARALIERMAKLKLPPQLKHR